MTEQTSSLPFT